MATKLCVRSAHPVPFKKISLAQSRKYRMGLISAIHLKTGGILAMGNMKPEKRIIGMLKKKLVRIDCC